MTLLVEIILLFLQIMWFAIFARAIISWFPIDQNGAVVRALDSITEPLLEPLRRVVPRVGMIDITPMVAIILIFVISAMLRSSLASGV
ncbi:MAG: YggT family protein [Chloroflexi bacterium]|nr:YggT family protein [Chloroflexota bacterium]MXZ47086.1 YggT family protein [Chloroflexota bacterium]